MQLAKKVEPQTTGHDHEEVQMYVHMQVEDMETISCLSCMFGVELTGGMHLDFVLAMHTLAAY